jgi:hypothetical protein
MKGSCNESLSFYMHMIKLKHILLEGKFDAYALEISREIVNAFKNKKNFKQDYEINRAGDYAEFELQVRFFKRPKQDYSHSITGGGDMQTLVLDIEYNPSMFPAAMNDFVAEVKETVTHELEHVGQQNFEDMFVVDNADHDNYFEYLTSNVEVPAYVKGLIKRAKTKRISLDAAMEEWYVDNKLNFEHHQVDWKKVKKIWVDWTLANKDKLKKFN